MVQKTRRGFLKATGAALGTAALGGCTASDNEQNTTQSLEEREEMIYESELAGLNDLKHLIQSDTEVYQDSDRAPTLMNVNRYDPFENSTITVQSSEIADNLENGMSPREAVQDADNLGDIDEQITDKMELPLLLDRRANVDLIDVGSNYPAEDTSYLEKELQDALPSDISLDMEKKNIQKPDGLQNTINTIEDSIKTYRQEISDGERESTFQIYLTDKPTEDVAGFVDAPDRDIDGVTALDEAYSIVELPNADQKAETSDNEQNESRESTASAALQVLGKNVLDLPHCYEKEDCAMTVEPDKEATQYGDHCELHKENYLNTEIEYREKEDGSVEISLKKREQNHETVEDDIESHAQNYFEKKHGFNMEEWNMADWSVEDTKEGQKDVLTFAYSRELETQKQPAFDISIDEYVEDMNVYNSRDTAPRI